MDCQGIIGIFGIFSFGLLQTVSKLTPSLPTVDLKTISFAIYLVVSDDRHQPFKRFSGYISLFLSYAYVLSDENSSIHISISNGIMQAGNNRVISFSLYFAILLFLINFKILK
jgi:hypothetical protein